MKNPAIIGFYGKSNTGKTTLITQIIRRLTKENYRIATIKITDKKIGIDKEDTDTWKHAQAGSELIVFSSPYETDYIVKEKQLTKEIINKIKKMGKYDIILVEGVHEKDIPKIRIGDIEERDNTILKYDGDFEKLIKILKNESQGGNLNG
jgi:molybdopterin-guanine dinucleotide biosynthesis protein B